MLSIVCRYARPSWQIDPDQFPVLALAQSLSASFVRVMSLWEADAPPEAADGALAEWLRFQAEFEREAVARVALSPASTHVYLGSRHRESKFVELAARPTRGRRACIQDESFSAPRPTPDFESFRVDPVPGSLVEATAQDLIRVGYFDWPTAVPPEGGPGHFDLVLKAGGRCRHVSIWPALLGGRAWTRVNRILGRWVREPGWRLSLAAWSDRLRSRRHTAGHLG